MVDFVSAISSDLMCEHSGTEECQKLEKTKRIICQHELAHDSFYFMWVISCDKCVGNAIKHTDDISAVRQRPADDAQFCLTEALFVHCCIMRGSAVSGALSDP